MTAHPSVHTDGSTPIYQHDCPDCRYLGDTLYKDELYDLYVCPKENGTLVARFSSYGPDYTSGLWFGAAHYSSNDADGRSTQHPLAEALRRAIRRAAAP